MTDELQVHQFGAEAGLVETEGCRIGSDVSIIVVNLPPGDGPALHRHPYSETFIVLEGRALFQVENKEMEVPAGSLVVVPANVPHSFKNPGPNRLRQVDVHASNRFITEWLDRTS